MISTPASLISSLLGRRQRTPLLTELLAHLRELDARVLLHDIRTLLLGELHEATELLLAALLLPCIVLSLLATELAVVAGNTVVISRCRSTLGSSTRHTEFISSL